MNAFLSRLFVLPLIAGMAACSLSSVQAAPLVLDNVSALDAARQISDQYGVNIVFKGDFGSAKPVSFTLTDADADGARLEAVNALANAIGADFTKTYVVSKAVGETAPALHIDSNASITFPSTTIPISDAVTMVANVDNAIAQVTPDVTGDVTFSATKLTDADAAAQIAKQSNTRWKVFYAMTPRTNGHALRGKIIGNTAGGSPITELPYVYYKHIPTPQERAAQQAAADLAAQQAAQQTAAQQTAQANAAGTTSANTQGMTQTGMTGYGNNNPYNGAPYSYVPNGNGYYGSNGGYTPPGVLGYGGNGSINTGSGLIIGGAGYGTGPIIFQTPGY
jgi:hypothetical protein